MTSALERGESEEAALLSHSEELHVEDQDGVWRNFPGAMHPVSCGGRNAQLALATNLHTNDPLVPTFYDAACAEGKSDGLAAIDGTIEFCAVCKPTGVMHAHGFSGYGGGPCSNHDVPILDARWSRFRLAFHF